MLTDYLNAALRHAHYEQLPDGEGYYGAISELPGVWATPILWKPHARICARHWRGG